MRKAQRRRTRRTGSGSVAVATAVAVGLAGTPVAAAGAPPAAAAPGGVMLVADFWPGVSSARPTSLVAFDGAVYFALDDGVHGRELWRSDGTAAGTVMVKDIVAGARSSEPVDLVVADTTLFFTANAADGRSRDLWKSDGTTSGTVFVSSVAPDEGSRDYQLTAVGGNVFFGFHDDEHGTELWTSDGSTAGTVLVKDIRPGTYEPYEGYYYDIPLSSTPKNLTAVGSTLFFTVRGEPNSSRELWKSDGTADGTTRVTDVIPGGRQEFEPRYLTESGGALFFRAGTLGAGVELWTSDGTEVGTVMVEDLAPGASYGLTNSSYPEHLTDVDGTLYFSARDSAGGELWTSDGTAAGTARVADIRPGEAWSYPRDFTAVGSSVLFTADNGTGRELWRTDGTAGGTVLVKDIWTGTSGSQPNAGYPGQLTASSGMVYFAARDARGREIWRSDGTAAGTVLLRDIRQGPGSSSPVGTTALPNGNLLFAANDGARGTELWTVGPGEPEPPVVVPSNAFVLPPLGTPNKRKGTLTIDVTLPGPGVLTLAPLRNELAKTVTKTVGKGRISVTITPTRAGRKALRKALDLAISYGRKVGRVKVLVAMTFTPTGGTPRTLTKKYILILKRK